MRTRSHLPSHSSLPRPSRIGLVPQEAISLQEASELAGVSASTLQRWARAGVIQLTRGKWTRTSAVQARVVARMRERGHSLEELRAAGREGRLSFGLAEDLFPRPETQITVYEVAPETGLEP